MQAFCPGTRKRGPFSWIETSGCLVRFQISRGAPGLCTKSKGVSTLRLLGRNDIVPNFVSGFRTAQSSQSNDDKLGVREENHKSQMPFVDIDHSMFVHTKRIRGERAWQSAHHAVSQCVCSWHQGSSFRLARVAQESVTDCCTGFVQLLRLSILMESRRYLMTHLSPAF